MSRTYNDGFNDGKTEMAVRMLNVLAEVYGDINDRELAGWLGIVPSNISQWRSGKASPHKNLLTKALKHVMSSPVIPLAEIEPIQPKKVKSWRIDADRTRRSELKQRLEKQCGVYLFYDSLGLVTYVGQAKSNLYTEIEQRMAQQLQTKTYTGKDISKTMVKKYLIQGNVVRYFSAYRTFNGQAAHNIEALLIRAYANDHQNRKLANIRLGSAWTT